MPVNVASKRESAVLCNGIRRDDAGILAQNVHAVFDVTLGECRGVHLHFELHAHALQPRDRDPGVRHLEPRSFRGRGVLHGRRCPKSKFGAALLLGRGRRWEVVDVSSSINLVSCSLDVNLTQDSFIEENC